MRKHMVMLTLRETAAELRLGSTKTWQLAATGAIPTVRFGRRVLVTRADLDQFIAAHREGGDGAAGSDQLPAAREGRRVRVNRSARA
jgi:excisionase family DNA binding protein